MIGLNIEEMLPPQADPGELCSAYAYVSVCMYDVYFVFHILEFYDCSNACFFLFSSTEWNRGKK